MIPIRKTFFVLPTIFHSVMAAAILQACVAHLLAP